MAKVTMNDNFPVSGGRLWQTIGAFDALPDWQLALESDAPEDGVDEVTRFDDLDTSGVSEADISMLIEDSFQFGFENLIDLFDR